MLALCSAAAAELAERVTTTLEGRLQTGAQHELMRARASDARVPTMLTCALSLMPVQNTRWMPYA